MPLKAKLILLTLLPLLLVTASISWISIHQAQTLGEREVEIFRDNLIQSRERTLQDSVEIAFNAIEHVVSDPNLAEPQAKRQVREILSRMRYGSDGYFFAYDDTGINLVHPIQPDLVGQNLLHIQDIEGNYLIEGLLKQARSGGGFHSYYWQKPSTGETVPKLSYAAWLSEWNWMIGTGLYMEDIAVEVAQMEAAVQRNIETTFFSVMVIVLITVAVIIVLTLAINLHEHRIADKNLKELAHKTVMFQEDEKKHLARELHDGINQLLVSSKCHLELLGNRLEDDTQKEYLTKSQQSLLMAINEVRHISHQLRPSALDDIGLNAALNTLLLDFSAHSGKEIEPHFGNTNCKLPSEVATTLYRVAQESLTNIEKHSQASKVELICEQLGGTLQLIIRDNGIGFNVHARDVSTGIGLRNMRERVEFIGGEFEILSEPGLGTEMTVLLEVDELVYG